MKYKLRQSFVCNNCRTYCSGTCSNELHQIENNVIIDDELFPRKQLIGCLGIYCDEPCKLQKESDLDINKLLNLTKWMGQKLNDLLIIM